MGDIGYKVDIDDMADIGNMADMADIGDMVDNDDMSRDLLNFCRLEEVNRSEGSSALTS